MKGKWAHVGQKSILERTELTSTWTAKMPEQAVWGGARTGYVLLDMHEPRLVMIHRCRDGYWLKTLLPSYLSTLTGQVCLTY